MGIDRAKKRAANAALSRETRQQRYVNGKVFRVLRGERDDLITPRPFFHWAYFKTKTARKTFIAKITKLKFSVVAETVPYSFDKKLPHGIEFTRVSSMDATALPRTCARLSLIASQLGGEYDGWEVQVVQSDAKDR
ncbi:MAG: ribonuclease E inhibitor RraB [Terriglobales bacterium]